MSLRRGDLNPDPLRQFERWYADAAAAGIEMPEAMALATVGDGAPSLRTVLLKGFDAKGYVFHTGYGSRKARELDGNPRAALLFHWAVLGRQVRIEGDAGRVTEAESEAYFRTRPRGSQIGAWASRQSERLEDREALEAAVAEADRRFPEGDVPRPAHWGGYFVRPESYEFWQHGDDRLHDRFRYRSAGGAWQLERLFP